MFIRLSLLLIGLGACGGGTNGTGGTFQSLPLRGDPAGPVVVNLWLGCVGGQNITVVVAVTHPNGTADGGMSTSDQVNLLSIFPQADGSGQPETSSFAVRQGDLHSVFSTSSGAGSFFKGSASAAVRTQLCAASTWPAQIELHDKAGHTTSGKVRAVVCADNSCW